MKKRVGTLILLTVVTTAYADNAVNVQQGAQEYDWQSCITSKLNDCLNACMISEDINCKDNCNDMANDKCLSEGFKKPQ